MDKNALIRFGVRRRKVRVGVNYLVQEMRCGVGHGMELWMDKQLYFISILPHYPLDKAMESKDTGLGLR